MKDRVMGQIQSFPKGGPLTLMGLALHIDVVKLLEFCVNGKEDEPGSSHAWWEPDLLKKALLETVLGREEMGFRG